MSALYSIIFGCFLFRVVGTYTLLLQSLVRNGEIKISEGLIDSNNQIMDVSTMFFFILYKKILTCQFIHHQRYHFSNWTLEMLDIVRKCPHYSMKTTPILDIIFYLFQFLINMFVTKSKLRIPFKNNLKGKRPTFKTRSHHCQFPNKGAIYDDLECC